jgi:hypothetical protein
MRMDRDYEKLGLRGATIWATPPKDLPPYSAAVYDPFWTTAQELAMLRSLHPCTGGRKAGHQELNNLVRIYVGSRDTE